MVVGGEGGQVEADLKVKKPTAPLKDTKQNRIGSPDITLRNYTAWCKIFPCAQVPCNLGSQWKGS